MYLISKLTGHHIVVNTMLYWIHLLDSVIYICTDIAIFLKSADRNE